MVYLKPSTIRTHQLQPFPKHPNIHLSNHTIHIYIKQPWRHHTALSQSNINRDIIINIYNNIIIIIIIIKTTCTENLKKYITQGSNQRLTASWINRYQGNKGPREPMSSKIVIKYTFSGILQFSFKRCCCGIFLIYFFVLTA